MSLHEGDWLKLTLKERGIRQEDFANQLGLSRNQLIVIMKGEVLPPKYREKVFKLLDTSTNSAFELHLKQIEERASEIFPPNLNAEIKKQHLRWVREQMRLLYPEIYNIDTQSKSIVEEAKEPFVSNENDDSFNSDANENFSPFVINLIKERNSYQEQLFKAEADKLFLQEQLRWTQGQIELLQRKVEELQKA